MQFVIWYLTWILLRKASAPYNCGCCCPSGAELCGCSESLVSMKFGKSQPPEEMQWFFKYIPLKQLPFWGCYQCCLSYSWPFNSSVQRYLLTSEREREAELIMNVLEKFLGGLDIACRDIYESVSLERLFMEVRNPVSGFAGWYSIHFYFCHCSRTKYFLS